MSLQKALRHFKKYDPQFHKATLRYHSSLPQELPMKHTRHALFERLVRTVISQQLGTAAAHSIFTRMKTACGDSITPESVAKVRIPALRAAGLSGAKVKTIKALSAAVRSGKLDLMKLRTIPEEEAAEKLMQIWGLGPWSVEMFLMFALGRADVFSAGDLGLIRAIETMYGLPKNCPREKLLKISSKWSPYRTYACLLLWRTRDPKNVPETK
jgi:DNA-3-methyladenine glycosylase II